MKIDEEMFINHLSWPVLVTDESGFIKEANRLAIKKFALRIADRPSLEATIWSKSNQLRPNDLLNKVKSNGQSCFDVSLTETKKGDQRYQLWISPFTQGGDSSLFLQAIPMGSESDSENQEIPVVKPVAGIGVGSAVKQKLDCAMQLTRTVALDFNNALTSILGHTSLLLGRNTDDDLTRQSLIQIEKSAEKAAEITNDLAAFSRQEKDGPTRVSGNIHDLLHRTIEIFESSNQPKINWNLNLEDELYAAKFDEAKIQLALMRVFENSLEAMGSEGWVSITCGNRVVDSAFNEGEVVINSGRYVYICIEDNGKGIAPEDLPRVFEPFFKTKTASKNRGLGLAWVYGIVTNHGGNVAISSEVGQGTSVKIYLPAEKTLVKKGGPSDEMYAGNQKILMVDDEELLLTMGQTVLSSFGYDVVTTTAGQEAVEILSKPDSEIDLVITDMVMPHMSGRELMERIKQISPDMPIICSSGYVRPSSDQEDSDYFLKKPFTSQDLLRKVKRLLS